MGVVVAKVDQKWYDRSSFCTFFNIINTFTINMSTKTQFFLQELYILFIPNTLLNNLNKKNFIKFKIFMLKMA